MSVAWSFHILICVGSSFIGISVGKWLQSHSVAELKRRREDATGDAVEGGEDDTTGLGGAVSRKRSRTGDDLEEPSDMIISSPAS